ncbi:MAG: OsmC family protein [Actinomycetes bacterium]
MQNLTVRGLGGDRYAIDVRGHEVLVDQPSSAGGDDSAPTPTELFVAGLASCVAFYAGRFCDRHGVDRAGLRVDLAWELAADRPARVGAIEVKVTPPAALPDGRRAAFASVVRHCTVHNTLEHPPPVEVSVVEVAPALAAAGPS